MISVILPVYRNEDFLAELIDRIHGAFDAVGVDHEIIGVNDCCPNLSLKILMEIVHRDSRLVVVDLKRNAGQHQAVLTGLTCASGDWIAVMDADLQDLPEILPGLLETAVSKRAIVFAGRRGKYESRARLFTSKIFKSILAVMAGVPLDAGMFFVAPGEVKERLVGMHTGKPFVVAMLGRIPIPKISQPVERSRRPSGHSSYSSRQRLQAAGRAVICAFQCRFGGLSGVKPDYVGNIRVVIRGKEATKCPG